MIDSNKSRNGLATAAGKANQLWADFVPVIAFVLVYNVFRRIDLFGGLINEDTALFWATGVLLALMGAFVVRQLIVREPVSQMMLLSSAIVGGFGLIGILLQERAFIYVKPTVQQLFMAALIWSRYSSAETSGSHYSRKCLTCRTLPGAHWRSAGRLLHRDGALE